MKNQANAANRAVEKLNLTAIEQRQRRLLRASPTLAELDKQWRAQQADQQARRTAQWIAAKAEVGRSADPGDAPGPLAIRQDRVHRNAWRRAVAAVALLATLLIAPPTAQADRSTGGKPSGDPADNPKLQCLLPSKTGGCQLRDVWLKPVRFRPGRAEDKFQLLRPASDNNYGGVIVVAPEWHEMDKGRFAFVGWRKWDYTSPKNGEHVADVPIGGYRVWVFDNSTAITIYQLPGGIFTRSKPTEEYDEVNADPPPTPILPGEGAEGEVSHRDDSVSEKERGLLESRRRQAEAELAASHSRPPRGSSGSGNGGPAQPSSANVKPGKTTTAAVSSGVYDSAINGTDDGGESKRQAAIAATPDSIKQAAATWNRATAKERAAVAPAVAAAAAEAEANGGDAGAAAAKVINDQLGLRE